MSKRRRGPFPTFRQNAKYYLREAIDMICLIPILVMIAIRAKWKKKPLRLE